MSHHDDKLRAGGLRPVRVWLPDMRKEGITAECARQALLIRMTDANASQDEDEAWLETSDTTGWTA